MTAAVLLRATVSPNAFGTLTNTVTVSSDTPDPDLSNNTDTALVAVNTAADLSVVKTTVSGPVPPGTLLVYTITVRNLGPDPAVNAVLTDDLPAGLSNAELSTDGGITFTPWSSPYALGTLPAGALRTLLLRAVVDLARRRAVQYRCGQQRYARSRPLEQYGHGRHRRRNVGRPLGAESGAARPGDGRRDADLSAQRLQRRPGMRRRTSS